MIRAQSPTQLFGLVPQKGMTTLAAPRSLMTSVTSVYHAQVDDELYHCRLGRKIQGRLWILSIGRFFRLPTPATGSLLLPEREDHQERRVVGIFLKLTPATWFLPLASKSASSFAAKLESPPASREKNLFQIVIHRGIY
jgi:hypothetical protein